MSKSMTAFARETLSGDQGELTWEPGGGFTATGSAEANSLGAFKLGTSLTKTIE